MFDFIDPEVMNTIVEVAVTIWGLVTLGSLLLDGLKQGGVIKEDGNTPKWMAGLAAAATLLNAILNVLPGGADGMMADLPALTQIAGHVVMVVTLALGMKLARYPLKWLDWTVSLTERAKLAAKG